MHYLPIVGAMFVLMFQIVVPCLLGNCIQLTVCIKFNKNLLLFQAILLYFPLSSAR